MGHEADEPGREAWDRLAAQLREARALRGDERTAYLDELRREDSQRAGELEELLAHGEQADEQSGFLDPSGWTESESVFLAAGAPGRIGPWRLLRRLGSGGMGDVHLARRDDGAYEQEVALKLVRADLDAPSLLARLRRERHVLARLAHPGIARLIDGGATQDGRPFLVMEYVDGRPLDEQLAELDLTARIKLLVAVCDAVASAHAEGVVHRDLKPSNVLVTRDGRPKLLDFGIAKLADGTAPDASLLTRTGDRLHTPRYAAPEQLLGEPASTATDVHALGVMLYEAVSGRSPSGAEGRTPREVEAAILDDTPAPPSRELTGTGVWTCSRADLDVVVMRALAKEPERRYPDAAALAADLRRLLDGRPVLARKDSAVYRMGAFIRRHRLLVAAGTVVLLSLTVGLVAALSANRTAVEQTRRAEWTGYTASLAAAEAALREGNAALARSQLDASPRALRGWEWDLLRGRLERSRTRWKVGAHVTAFAVAPSLEVAVSCVADDSGTALVLVDPHSGAARDRVALPEQAKSAAILDDGTLFVATSSGVWRRAAEGGGALERVLEQTGQLAAAQDTVFVGGSSGVVHAFDGGSSSVVSSSPVGDAIQSVACSLDGQFVAAGLWSGEVVLLDPATLDVRTRLAGHTAVVTALDFDPRAQRIASASIDGRVNVWDVSSGGLLSSHTASAGTPNGVAFSPTGDVLASRGTEGPVVLSEPDSGEVLTRLFGAAPGAGTLHSLGDAGLVAVDRGGTSRTFSWDDEDVWTRNGCEFSNTVLFPDDERLLVASPDDRLRIWRPDDTGPADVVLKGELSEDAHGSVLLGDGRTVVSVLRAYDRLRVWDLQASEVIRDLDLEVGGSLRGLAAGSDGRTVWVAAQGPQLFQLEPREGEPRTLTLEEGPGMQCADLLVGPGGAWIAVLWMQGRLGIYEPSTGERMAVFERAPFVDGRMALSPDGRSLVATADHDALVVIDTERWQPTASLDYPGGGHPVLALAFHPDGSRLVSGHADGTLRVWRTDGWGEVVRLIGHRGVVGSVAFDSTGRTLASCDWTGRVHWWRP